MSPLLANSLVVKDSDEIKYVRVGDSIALHDEREFNSHDTIARKYFPDVKRLEGKPLVDDAGTVTLYGGRIFFAGHQSISCKTEGDFSSAREKTKAIAISILGPERVG